MRSLAFRIGFGLKLVGELIELVEIDSRPEAERVRNGFRRWAPTCPCLLAETGAKRPVDHLLERHSKFARPPLQDTGQIIVDGERINGIDPDKIVRRGIFQVMEGRRIIADMTSLENLKLGAFTRSDNEVSSDIEMVFNYFPRLKERTGLAGYLSGGEQQMLAIGRALMARPKMILMDEPSMGLSPLLVKEVFSIIREINRDLGVTILLVEQNARAALSVASHGYIMEQGKVVLDGSADELRDNEDVKEFYLGGAGDQRKSFKNLKSFKRRKRWL